MEKFCNVQNQEGSDITLWNHILLHEIKVTKEALDSCFVVFVVYDCSGAESGCGWMNKGYLVD